MRTSNRAREVRTERLYKEAGLRRAQNVETKAAGLLAAALGVLLNHLEELIDTIRFNLCIHNDGHAGLGGHRGRTATQREGAHARSVVEREGVAALERHDEQSKEARHELHHCVWGIAAGWGAEPRLREPRHTPQRQPRTRGHTRAL